MHIDRFLSVAFGLVIVVPANAVPHEKVARDRLAPALGGAFRHLIHTNKPTPTNGPRITDRPTATDISKICDVQIYTVGIWDEYGIGDALVSAAAKATPAPGMTFIDWLNSEIPDLLQWDCSPSACTNPDGDPRQNCLKNPWAYATMLAVTNFFNYVYAENGAKRTILDGVSSLQDRADSFAQTFNPIEIPPAETGDDGFGVFFAIFSSLISLIPGIGFIGRQVDDAVEQGLATASSALDVGGALVSVGGQIVPDYGYIRLNQDRWIANAWSAATDDMVDTITEYINGMLFTAIGDADYKNFSSDARAGPWFFSNIHSFEANVELSDAPAFAWPESVDATFAASVLNELWDPQKTFFMTASSKSLGFDPCALEPGHKVSPWQKCDDDGNVWVVATWPYGTSEGAMGDTTDAFGVPKGLDKLGDWGLDLVSLGLSSLKNQREGGYKRKSKPDIGPDLVDPSTPWGLVYSTFPVCEMDNLLPFLDGQISGNGVGADPRNSTFWTQVGCSCPFNRVDGEMLPYAYASVEINGTVLTDTVGGFCSWGSFWPMDCDDCGFGSYASNQEALGKANWPGTNCDPADWCLPEESEDDDDEEYF